LSNNLQSSYRDVPQEMLPVRHVMLSVYAGQSSVTDVLMFWTRHQKFTLLVVSSSSVQSTVADSSNDLS